MFRNREEAARRLVQRLNAIDCRQPLVVAISGGGLVTAAAIAEMLGAELDLIQTRHLRAPGDPTLAVGAIAETGDLHLNHRASRFLASKDWFEHLQNERESRLAEIQEAMASLHQVLPPAHVCGRSILVVDDGVITGSTMIAALKAVRFEMPHEVIAMAPVVATEAIADVHERCDQLLYLRAPEGLCAVRDCYEQFDEVDSEQIGVILKRFAGLRRRIDFRRVTPLNPRPVMTGGEPAPRNAKGAS